MSTPQLPEFGAFYKEVTGFAPFPWQEELAARAVAGDWPDYLKIPTGCGKTSVLEIAVYALAKNPDANYRRIFYVVNRRVIVDEAYRRAQELACKLYDAARDGSHPLHAVAMALQARRAHPDGIAHEVPPLDAVELRGAMYQDHRWVRSLTQPTVVATTIDQLGSRLLFRGYGLRPQAWPIHAALVAHDALWILDEAHISQAFAQTVQAIQRLRELRPRPADAQSLRLPPSKLVQMTATPPQDGRDQVLELTPADRAHDILRQRLSARKPTRLELADKVKGRGPNRDDRLAQALIAAAEPLLPGSSPNAGNSLAIMVNRVTTARRVHALLADRLRKGGKGKSLSAEPELSLVIGRMRPLDRDEQVEGTLKPLRTGKTASDAARPQIVVATQCLEVGADLDFAALVTEAASLDALRQRFGRLNRSGTQEPSQGVIVMPGDAVVAAKDLRKRKPGDKPADPLYGDALAATWNWLLTQATDGVVDFGMEALQTPAVATDLNRPSPHAPTLLPTHLDAWAQTSPAPHAEPAPELFLHGPQTAQPEVLVCWRADLPTDAFVRTKEGHDTPTGQAASARDRYRKTVLAACPPSRPEALPVPLATFRTWYFADDKNAPPNPATDLGDLLSAASEESDNRRPPNTTERHGIVWRGKDDCTVLSAPGQLRPGDTIVLPIYEEGWEELGHIPNADKTNPRALDIGDEAYAKTRDRKILRCYEGGFFGPLAQGTTEEPEPSDADPWSAFLTLIRHRHDADPPTKAELNEALNALKQCDTGPDDAALAFLQEHFSELNPVGFEFRSYPLLPGEERSRGLILWQKERQANDAPPAPALVEESDDDDLSFLSHQEELQPHSQLVGKGVAATTKALWAELPAEATALATAAQYHDWGKLDPRFQALLRGGDLATAWEHETALAKSSYNAVTMAERIHACQRAQLPRGFRHELASLAFLDDPALAATLPADALGDLVRHLIAAHHGYCRPFAPVVEDREPPPLDSSLYGLEPTAHRTTDERRAHPAHGLASGVSTRFWELTHRYDWWGLAYLEAILRLADQLASEAAANPTNRAVQ